LIKNQVFAGLGLIIMAAILFFLVVPFVYLDSLQILRNQGVKGSFIDFQPGATRLVNFNTSQQILVFAYNTSGGGISTQLSQGSANISPVSAEMNNHTVIYGYQLSTPNSNNYTMVFYNNDTTALNIDYYLAPTRINNVALLSLISYATIGLFVAGVAVVIMGAARKPRNKAGETGKIKSGQI